MKARELGEITAVLPTPSMSGMLRTSTGAVVSPDVIPYPSTFITRRSVCETAFTTPELLKARKESWPALDAQSPKSPPELVLKLSRLLAPPLSEKYPGVVPTKSRAPGDE